MGNAYRGHRRRRGWCGDQAGGAGQPAGRAAAVGGGRHAAVQREDAATVGTIAEGDFYRPSASRSSVPSSRGSRPGAGIAGHGRRRGVPTARGSPRPAARSTPPILGGEPQTAAESSARPPAHTSSGHANAAIGSVRYDGVVAVRCNASGPTSSATPGLPACRSWLRRTHPEGAANPRSRGGRGDLSDGPAGVGRLCGGWVRSRWTMRAAAVLAALSASRTLDELRRFLGGAHGPSCPPRSRRCSMRWTGGLVGADRRVRRSGGDSHDRARSQRAVHVARRPASRGPDRAGRGRPHEAARSGYTLVNR